MPILSAPEVRGKVCAVCGGTLLRHRKRFWCDWCGHYVTRTKDDNGP